MHPGVRPATVRTGRWGCMKAVSQETCLLLASETTRNWLMRNILADAALFVCKDEEAFLCGMAACATA